MTEECLRHRVNRVSEESAVHKAPESRGEAAPEEELQHLRGALRHSRKLLQQHGAADGHHDAVASVRKHHAEENYIEDRHHEGRIHSAVLGQTIGREHALHVPRERVIGQKRRLILFVSVVFLLHNRAVSVAEQLRDPVSLVRRHPALEEEGALRLRNRSEHAVLLRASPVVVRGDPEILPAVRIGDDVGFQFFDSLLLGPDVFLALAHGVSRHGVHGLRRSRKPDRPQVLLHLVPVLLQTDHGDTGHLPRLGEHFRRDTGRFRDLL